MKHALLTIVFIVLAGQLCLIGLPWWSVAPISALAGWLFPQKPIYNFLAGFAGGFLLWAIQAMWLDAANDGLLSARIGKLFMGMSSPVLLVFTGVLGGLLGGMGCLTGRLARDLVSQPAKAR